MAGRRYAGHVIGSASTIRIHSAEGKRRARNMLRDHREMAGIESNFRSDRSLRNSNTRDIGKKRKGRSYASADRGVYRNDNFASRLRTPGKRASTGHSGG